MTWREYDQWSSAFARLLSDRGVDESSLVVIGLPNGWEHYVATAAIWKLGACTLAVNANAPEAERGRLLNLAKPGAVIADWLDCGAISSRELLAARDRFETSSLPDQIAHPARAVASGGSTGHPKIIRLSESMEGVPGDLGLFGEIGGMAPDQTQLVVGPLYHNMPQIWSHMGLFHGHTIVVMERFDANLAVELIERHRINFAAMVPTHMLRIAKLPDIGERDLSSIQAILHAGAACPEWVKRAWIKLIGAEKVYEAFGATEAVGICAIRGDEWLRHPGSVGRPVDCELRIIGDAGNECAPGEVGEIYTRPFWNVSSFEYIGAQSARTTQDGFVSMGDLGWVDEEGYLFIADRRVDMIVSGGVNVYPAEVESALSEHPLVADCVVIGLPDHDLGRRVHALIEPVPGAEIGVEEIQNHCRKRLSRSKVPRTVELVARLPRNDAGKIQRTTLTREREQS